MRQLFPEKEDQVECNGGLQVANNAFFSVLYSSLLLRRAAAVNTMSLNTGST